MARDVVQACAPWRADEPTAGGRGQELHRPERVHVQIQHRTEYVGLHPLPAAEIKVVYRVTALTQIVG
jgi:hypothetical protein